MLRQQSLRGGQRRNTVMQSIQYFSRHLFHARDKLFQPALPYQQVDGEIEYREWEVDGEFPKPDKPVFRPEGSNEAIVDETHVRVAGETGVKVTGVGDVRVQVKGLKI